MIQQHLRPLLHPPHTKNAYTTRSLRGRYASVRDHDPEKRRMFDGFKCLKFSDFRQFQRIPRSNDPLIFSHLLDAQQASRNQSIENPFIVIFISYRWINKTLGLRGPDDANNTQYKRIVHTVEDWLETSPQAKMKRFELGIWIVSALKLAISTFTMTLTSGPNTDSFRTIAVLTKTIPCPASQPCQ
jgi:hypothetical protein